MYRAFNVTGVEWANSRTSGEEIYEKNKVVVQTTLESFIKDGIIDGSNLSAHWFPMMEVDVFISHSHQDHDQAIEFAGWLKNCFGLDSFIDSCVWGYSDDLLRIIDNKYCYQSASGMYDYLSRNGSTSHVHMMLANALSEMLDKAECVFFINSPNSINSKEAVDKTKSPWLFFELSAIRVMRRIVPKRSKLHELIEGSATVKKASKLPIEYVVSLEELTPLSLVQFRSWGSEYIKNRDQNPLDLLYDIAPENPPE